MNGARYVRGSGCTRGHANASEHAFLSAPGIFLQYSQLGLHALAVVVYFYTFNFDIFSCKQCSKPFSACLDRGVLRSINRAVWFKSLSALFGKLNFPNLIVKPYPSVSACSESLESQMVSKNFLFFVFFPPTLKVLFLPRSLCSFPIGTYNGVHQSEKSESHHHLFTPVRQ